MHWVYLIVFYCILLFERLKFFLLFGFENIPKNPAKSMRATPACLFTCMCIAPVILIFCNNEKRNPKN